MKPYTPPTITELEITAVNLCESCTRSYDTVREMLGDVTIAPSIPLILRVVRVCRVCGPALGSAIDRAVTHRAFVTVNRCPP